MGASFKQFIQFRKMYWIKRGVVIFSIFQVVFANEQLQLESARKSRSIIGLLGYIHGFKVGQSYALQLATFLVQPPIILVPSANVQQSVNVQKATTDENYQEIGDSSQTISSSKIVEHSLKYDQAKAVNKLNELHTSSKRETNNKDISKVKQVSNGNNFETNSVSNNLELIDNTTENSLMTTNEAINGNNEDAEEAIVDMGNFSNLTVTNGTESNINSSEPSVTLMETNTSSIQNVVNVSETISFGPYPAAQYNNSFVSEISLTTTSPLENEANLPPVNDDRWKIFQNNPSSNGFRPLAGLYYDGFLHMPLRKLSGWTPFHK